jgi:hypothetical protein
MFVSALRVKELSNVPWKGDKRFVSSDARRWFNEAGTQIYAPENGWNKTRMHSFISAFAEMTAQLRN